MEHLAILKWNVNVAIIVKNVAKIVNVGVVGTRGTFTLNFDEYQAEARKTAIYPKEHAVTYPTLGLAGEAGEFANKVKKILRDGAQMDSHQKLLEELGDVLWYVANVACDLDVDLDYVAALNLEKLKSRQERDQIKGSGDNR